MIITAPSKKRQRDCNAILITRRAGRSDNQKIMMVKWGDGADVCALKTRGAKRSAMLVQVIHVEGHRFRGTLIRL